MHCSCSPAPSATKCNSIFEISFLIIFSLKQKANEIHACTAEKIKFCLFKITMKKCKAKSVQADLGIFTHISVNFSIFKIY